MKYIKCKHNKIIEINGKLRNICEDCIEDCIREDERIRLLTVLSAVKNVPENVIRILQARP